MHSNLLKILLIIPLFLVLGGLAENSYAIDDNDCGGKNPGGWCQLNLRNISQVHVAFYALENKAEFQVVTRSGLLPPESDAIQIYMFKIDVSNNYGLGLINACQNAANAALMSNSIFAITIMPTSGYYTSDRVLACGIEKR